jgi:DNA processing protein
MGETNEQARWISVAAALPREKNSTAPFDWRSAIAEQQSRAAAAGARLVVIDDEEYPALLREIAAPPPFLFFRGELQRGDALAIALVGSRQASSYGVQVAERLAEDLAVRGITIVSGFARGIDSAAHRGALRGGGRTVAVLGSGVDVVYPPENRRLLERVLRAGALLSQFPMGTPPLQQHFPLRNRTIAGMSLGTVVVEAAEQSGALITARHAADLGREVFAVPGSIHSQTSRGSHRLIQDGAKLVQGWSDVIDEFPEAWRRCLREPEATTDESGLEEGENRLLMLLGDEPVHIERLTERSGFAPSRTAGLLVTLELKGRVRQLPGQRYVLARRG